MARTRNLYHAQAGLGEVAAHVGKLVTTGDDYARAQAIGPGTVLELPGAAASKWRTEVDLRFGEATLSTGNVSPGFAGLYSFWLRAPGEGSTEWRLVFNDEADVWERSAIPLEIASTSRSSTRWLPTRRRSSRCLLTGQGDDGGLFELRWGTHRWRASFTAAPR